jgi:hypothetical protein
VPKSSIRDIGAANHWLSFLHIGMALCPEIVTLKLLHARHGQEHGMAQRHGNWAGGWFQIFVIVSALPWCP